jgi:AraC-like DNA-binding protein
VASLSRSPCAALRPFVSRLWALEANDGPTGARERVLPTGCMHVVVRLADEPLTVFGSDDGPARVIGGSVIGGARSAHYVRAVPRAVRSIGAQLLPGGGALLGLPAGELAETHTRLDDVWGRDAARLRERLADAATLEKQLDAMESWLLARLPRVRGVHPVVADAVGRFHASARVGDAVERSGYSHRAFLTLFREAVGLAPKTFCRVLRVQRAIHALGEGCSLAGAAADAGYADQAHFARDFAAIAGVAPSRYLALSPQASNHVPIPPRG